MRLIKDTFSTRIKLLKDAYHGLIDYRVCQWS